MTFNHSAEFRYDAIVGDNDYKVLGKIEFDTRFDPEPRITILEITDEHDRFVLDITEQGSDIWEEIKNTESFQERAIWEMECCEGN